MDERRKADVNGLDDNNVLKSSRGGLDSLEKDGAYQRGQECCQLQSTDI